MDKFNDIATKEDRAFHSKIRKALNRTLGPFQGNKKYTQLISVANVAFRTAYDECICEIKRNNYARKAANLIFTREIKRLGVKLDES